MVTTRATGRSIVRDLAIVLPDELWILILSKLGPLDIARAVCTSHAISAISQDIWQAACETRWPAWSGSSAAGVLCWKRQYEIFELRKREYGTQADIEAIQTTQSIVEPHHRLVLCEWLCEVTWDWRLDSTLLFKAVGYLDSFLQRCDVPLLTDFQLVGLACLRAAMGDAVPRRSPRLRPPSEHSLTTKLMDPLRFSDISDRTYTVEQVEACTAHVSRYIPKFLKEAPTAKVFLRSFWYRCLLGGVAGPEEMHVYTLASFLLQLSTLDLEVSSYAPSCVAAAALCDSFVSFGKEEWPSQMAGYTMYHLDELKPVRERLGALQSHVEGGYLRDLWCTYHHSRAYDRFKDEWSHALLVMSAPKDLRPLSCKKDSTSTAPVPVSLPE